MKHFTTPLSVDQIRELKPGDKILLSGKIFTGRDAVLPKLVELFKSEELTNLGADLEGGVIFHTAVSSAGVGPTSSNKLEIESSMEPLSQAGIRIHLGKGRIKNSTIKALGDNLSAYATMPPVTALLKSKIKSTRLVAFGAEGMEAMYELDVDEIPIIIAAVNGASLYGSNNV